MSETPIILLIEDNEKHVRQITGALERRHLPAPLHMSRGDEAVAWMREHTPALCLIDYDLPDTDGLDTLVRIHQRKPDLPIIMMSDARSEPVAVAAYEIGIVDYVQKKGGFDDTIADLVGRHLHNKAPEPERARLMPPHAAPEHLLRPTYENRLRVVGRKIDEFGYHTINLLEVDTSILVRGLPRGSSRNPEAVEFLNSDFEAMALDGYNLRGKKESYPPASPLLPTGYEDFLRALGYELDRRRSCAITVTELDTFVAVGGIDQNDGLSTPFQTLLRSADIALLLDEAFKRRAPKSLGFRRT